MINSILFDGHDALFKKVLAASKVYGEYGCGQSTLWVLENTDCPVIAVDTSKDWVDRVLSKASRECDLKHVDLGPVGGWGRPTGYSKKDDFHLYTDYLWKSDKNIDTVLIDGRFRVCCFLTTIKYSKEGTSIIFDDYTNRHYYHEVEKYVKREDSHGRQCLFITPPKEKLDMESLDSDILKYRNVMD